MARRRQGCEAPPSPQRGMVLADDAERDGHMAFAIMRAKKLSGMGSVAASLQHCYRDRETLNADKEQTPANEHLAATSTDEAMGKLKARLPEKRRKDAVLAVEYVMTASPKWWENASSEQQKAFFDRSVGWLADKYGADNVVTATIHRDELTPHLSAFVVPRTADGRLSAKEFIGNRTKMSRDQTTYAERVADLGLERGIEGSRATHQRVKAHYGALEKANLDSITIKPESLEPKVLRQGMFTKEVETPEMVAERLSKSINDENRATAEKASVSAHNERRAKELVDTASSKERSLKALREPFRGLSNNQIASVLQMAVEMQQGNEKAREQRKEESLRRDDEDYSR